MKKIREYVNEIMENAPKTKKTSEFKEELIADLTEKYNDLIKDGKKENEAYQEVISSIGNIDEVISSHKMDEDINESKKKSALTVSICVGLYIFAFIATIITDEYLSDTISGIVFLTICGISTCILIYNQMTKPNYKKQDDTMVEEFKEWKANKTNRNEIRNSISSILWTLIIIIYFLVSFMFSIWYISWILFIVGGLLESVISLIFKLGEK